MIMIFCKENMEILNKKKGKLIEMIVQVTCCINKFTSI